MALDKAIKHQFGMDLAYWKIGGYHGECAPGMFGFRLEGYVSKEARDKNCPAAYQYTYGFLFSDIDWSVVKDEDSLRAACYTTFKAKCSEFAEQLSAIGGETPSKQVAEDYARFADAKDC